MANVIAKCSCGTVTTLVDWQNVWKTDETASRLFQLYGAVQCQCGRKPNGFVTHATKKAAKRECGAWCTDGTGRSCTCVCEGRNHGTKYSHTGALWYAK